MAAPGGSALRRFKTCRGCWWTVLVARRSLGTLLGVVFQAVGLFVVCLSFPDAVALQPFSALALRSKALHWKALRWKALRWKALRTAPTTTERTAKYLKGLSRLRSHLAKQGGYASHVVHVCRGSHQPRSTSPLDRCSQGSPLWWTF